MKSTTITGKSVSEALILESVNPQYDDRLFIDSWLQYKKNTTSEHVVYKHCFLFLFWSSKQCLYTTCSQLVFFLYWIQEWMNNLSSYCGLTDSRISASEKDLPVLNSTLCLITTVTLKWNYDSPISRQNDNQVTFPGEFSVSKC